MMFFGDHRADRSGARIDLLSAIFCFLAASIGPALAEPQAPLDAKVYDRAASFLPGNLKTFILNATISPHWRSAGRERLTYLKALGEDRGEFVSVDAVTGKAAPAFDHAVIAAGLSTALGKTIEANKLPFTDYAELDNALRFDAEGKRWDCSTNQPSCTGKAMAPSSPVEVPSPDGKWVAFTQSFNLWIRSADGKTRFPLTKDGVEHYAYAVETELAIGSNSADGKDHARLDSEGRRVGFAGPTIVLWSSDSKHLVTHRLDERKVREMPIVQAVPTDGTVRPVGNRWRMAMPNDPVIPTAEPWIFDIASRKGHKIGIDPMPTVYMTAIVFHDLWWSPDNREIYLIRRGRFNKSMTLFKVDAATGAARQLISETGKTFVESANLGARPMVYVLGNGDIIWFSERDGWGSLYLYDGGNGMLKRRLTSTGWTVRNVLHLDEKKGAIFVAGNEHEAGIDPYYRLIYRVGIADGALTLLTSEDADHVVHGAQESIFPEAPPIPGNSLDDIRGFSPTGRYFVETIVRTDSPSRTILRASDGTMIAEIERADISRLKAHGYTPPERFTALAADGVTMLYGTLFRPTDFDPAKRYAIIDSPYPGPQIHRTLVGFENTVFDPFGAAQAVAELGFIVFTVDGRGSHGRSKAFHDESYGGLGQAGHLDDHVAVIKELGRRYPFVDLDRVGIYGISGGGYATAHALFNYPDVFKVGVADAGNHDQRGYLATWGETYNGPEIGTNYTDAANALVARNLKGKLFLLHGDMDINVSPYLTLQVVDALIKANKDFDLLIVPNAGHGTMRPHSYGMRRCWDYLVRNLQGLTPPVDYDLTLTDPARKAAK